jgi:hypothetical protein
MGENVKLIKVVEEGVENWLANSEFKCSYSYEEGVVSSKIQAKQFPEKLDSYALVLHGDFIKSKTKTLVSVYVQHDRYTPPQSLNGVFIVSEDLAADYVPDEKSSLPCQLFVYEREHQQKMLPCPVVGYPIPCCYPITYASGPAVPNPVSLMKVLQKMGVKLKTQATLLESGEIKISFQFNEGIGNENEFFVIFTSKYSFPVPIEKYSKVIYSNGKTHEERCIASDFVDVGNGVVIPKKIISYKGPMRDWRGKEFEGKWLIKKWYSDDLGNEKPTDSDFLIKINPGTTFGGFAIDRELELIKQKPLFFDFNSLKLEELQNPLTIGNKEVESSGYFTFRVVLMSLGVLLIGIACVRLWKEHFGK